METNVLESAKKVLNGERQDLYGPPERNFKTVAEYWSTYLNNCEYSPNLRPSDVAAMMTLFKIARLQGDAYVEDNIIDGIGYLTIYSNLVDKNVG